MRITSILLLLGLTFPAVASATELRLAWVDNSPNETGFLIERRTETEETFIPFDKVDADITSYVDYTTEAGITYCYEVRAVNSEDTSAPSNEVCSQAQ